MWWGGVGWGRVGYRVGRGSGGYSKMSQVPPFRLGLYWSLSYNIFTGIFGEKKHFNFFCYQMTHQSSLVSKE